MLKMWVIVYTHIYTRLKSKVTFENINYFSSKFISKNKDLKKIVNWIIDSGYKKLIKFINLKFFI